SLKVIEDAVKRGADFLVVHHGLFWNKDPYPIVGSKRKKLKLLLDHDISLIAYHLPLDAHPEVGNNFKAAKDMGWQNLEPFYDIGVRGTFSPMDRKAFQKQLELYYGREAHTVFGGKETVSSAALISGGAYRQIADASAVGVDAYITGNVDEPAYHLAKEEGINFFALGHDATEKVGPKALMEHLQQKFPLQTTFLGENNPF
ncbi:MAG: Nif3-like dinuclear metal center hexameric protein, partial [Chlamydiia bacterium]|nr:Nif3-like dinuclear metal center hexameric protein [Chlamydiia bacterium]